MSVRLSHRLQTICDMVPGGIVADVGCDHGFCSIYLVQEGICSGAIAMDVRPGPLERATRHVAEQGLGDRITLRLGNGFEKLKNGEANGCIIAGMGGPLMQEILLRGKEVASHFDYLILQPQSEIPQFRRFLVQNGYCIKENRVLEEDGIFYFPMHVVPDKKAERSEDFAWVNAQSEDFSLAELYGEDLLVKGSALGPYLKVQSKSLENILEKLPEGEGYAQRRAEVEQLLEQNRQAQGIVL